MAGTDSPSDDVAPGAKREAKIFGEAKDELAAYFEYNRILRAWFVAFGVGGPALFLINEQLGKRLAQTGQLRFVSTMFLIGAGSQVFGAVNNKISNWYVYRGAIDHAYEATSRYRFFKWWVLQFWVDVLLDVVTIACFGLATWRLLTLLGGSG